MMILDLYKYAMTKMGFSFAEFADSDFVEYTEETFYYDKILTWKDQNVSEHVHNLCFLKRETTFKDVYRYMHAEIRTQAKFPQRFVYENSLRQYKMLTKTLKLFPEELTSKEEIDLLLTLNGLNVC